MDKKRIMNSFRSSYRPLLGAIPMILGVVMLISFISILIPNKIYMSLFTGIEIIDSFIASAFGSILAGNPVTSYIMGGEFKTLGISMTVIISFLVAWVTVGIIQLPAEIIMLGKKFAISRNILSFILAVFVAITSVFLAGLLI